MLSLPKKLWLRSQLDVMSAKASVHHRERQPAAAERGKPDDDGDRGTDSAGDEEARARGPSRPRP